MENVREKNIANIDYFILFYFMFINEEATYKNIWIYFYFILFLSVRKPYIKINGFIFWCACEVGGGDVEMLAGWMVKFSHPWHLLKFVFIMHANKRMGCFHAMYP